jgi:hypothetical protein
LPDFSDTIYQNGEKYTKWPKNIYNGRKIDQDFPLQDSPKFTPIKIFGSKTNHLATLFVTVVANPVLKAKREKKKLTRFLMSVEKRSLHLLLSCHAVIRVITLQQE